MPWVCTPRAPLSALGLPTPPHRHHVGHGFRRALRHWGASHTAAAVSWHCVWIAPALAGAGGAAYGVGRWLSGIGGAVVGAAPGVVPVPEPSCALVLLLGVAVLAWVRRA